MYYYIQIVIKSDEGSGFGIGIGCGNRITRRAQKNLAWLSESETEADRLSAALSRLDERGRVSRDPAGDESLNRA